MAHYSVLCAYKSYRTFSGLLLYEGTQQPDYYILLDNDVTCSATRGDNLHEDGAASSFAQCDRFSNTRKGSGTTSIA